MPVYASVNALDNVSFTLSQFKKAFALTEGGEFAHTVEKTKGEFYVKDGKLCSANIHGGIGTVESAVSNKALRQALYTALTTGCSMEFEKKVAVELDPNSFESLNRKLVKRLLEKYENEIGEIRTQPVENPETDETGEKPLASRNIKMPKADKKLAGLVSLVDQFKDAAWQIRDFLALYGDQLSKSYRVALEKFAALQDDLCQLTQRLLGEENVDVSSVKERIGSAVAAFQKDHPHSYPRLMTLHRLCNRSIQRVDEHNSNGAAVVITGRGVERLKHILKPSGDDKTAVHDWVNVLAQERLRYKNPDIPVDASYEDYIGGSKEKEGVTSRDFLADCKFQLLPTFDLLKPLDPNWMVPPPPLQTQNV